MRIEIENNQLDLGTTPIENMFINTYLSNANEIQIKVYLYALMNAYSGNNNITNENIANEMNLSEGQVVDSWKYWIGEGIVEFKDNRYIFKSVRYQYISAMNPELMIDNNMSNIEENSYLNTENNIEDNLLQDNEEAKESRELIENIEQFISQGQDVPIKLDVREIKKILELMRTFGVSTEFMSFAYMMASNIRGLKSVDPVVATIRNWLLEGATDLEKLEKHLEEKEKKEKERKEKKSTSNSDKSTKNKLYEKDNRMSKEERLKFVEEKLKRKIPIRKRKDR